jgi:hypothetical protein
MGKRVLHEIWPDIVDWLIIVSKGRFPRSRSCPGLQNSEHFSVLLPTTRR